MRGSVPVLSGLDGVDVFTDGACQDPKDPRVRRVGWGCVWFPRFLPTSALEEWCQPLGFSLGGVGGSRQTVAKAELWAVTHAIQHSQGNVVVHTDNKRVVQGWQAGPRRTQFYRDAADWTVFWQAVAAFPGFVSVTWVKAHCTARHMVEGRIQAHQLIGNTAADKLAGYAAYLHQCIGLRRTVADRDRQVLGIQSRLLEVTLYDMAHFPHAEVLDEHGNVLPKAQEAGAKAPRVTLALLRAASSHDLQFSAGWVKCRRCGKRRGRLQTCSWLKKYPACPGEGPVQRPAQVVDQVVVVCRKPLHASHKLWAFRGIFWCVDCGGWAHLRAQRLLHPCKGKPTASGARGLTRLAQGLPPRPLVQWPG